MAIRQSYQAGKTLVPLSGFAIGNGWFKPLLQYQSVLDVALTLGYAGHPELEQARGKLAECKALMSRLSMERFLHHLAGWCTQPKGATIHTQAMSSEFI